VPSRARTAELGVSLRGFEEGLAGDGEEPVARLVVQAAVVLDGLREGSEAAVLGETGQPEDDVAEVGIFFDRVQHVELVDKGGNHGSRKTRPGCARLRRAAREDAFERLDDLRELRIVAERDLEPAAGHANRDAGQRLERAPGPLGEGRVDGRAPARLPARPR
jgi:hypothetical protein